MGVWAYCCRRSESIGAQVSDGGDRLCSPLLRGLPVGVKGAVPVLSACLEVLLTVGAPSLSQGSPQGLIFRAKMELCPPGQALT